MRAAAATAAMREGRRGKARNEPDAVAAGTGSVALAGAEAAAEFFFMTEG